jgi:hypothetical protein
VAQCLKEDEKEAVIIPENKVETIQISLNIQEIDNMFTMEEEKYVMNLHKLFYKAWQGISFGEKVINETVEFCRDRSKHTFSKEYFHVVKMANK